MQWILDTGGSGDTTISLPTTYSNFFVVLIGQNYYSSSTQFLSERWLTAQKISLSQVRSYTNDSRNLACVGT